MSHSTTRKQFASFFSHSGDEEDEQGRNNHLRVMQIAQALKARGLPVGTEDAMTGDSVAQMRRKGIEDSDTAVVFITQGYALKLFINEWDDDCKEFAFSVDRLGVRKLIPVVLEERMRDPQQWIGRLGYELGRVLYVKMWEDSDMTGVGLERLIEEILKRAPAWRSEVKASGVAATAPAHSAAKACRVRVKQLEGGHVLVDDFAGRKESIKSVAISRDGTQIASGGYDKTVVLWNSATGAKLHTLTGHTNDVWSVAISPDGRSVASGSEDSTIRLWDASSGQQQQEMNAGSAVLSVAYSPDGAFLACGCEDYSVQLWRVADGTQVWREQDEDFDYVWSLAFAPDGQTLASASGRTVLLWATADGQLRWSLEQHERDVFCVAFSPDGKQLASGGDWQEFLDYSGCNTVILWDPRHGRQLHELQGQTSDVRSVAFNPCGQRLLSGGAGTVRVWDTANGQHLLTFSLEGSHVPFFHSLPSRWQPVFCFEADGSVTVATHNGQTTVAVWRLGLPL